MRSIQKLSSKAILWTILLTTVALAGLAFRRGDCKPRILSVATYPYVPENAKLQLKIAQDFEKNNPDVQVEFVDLGDYYGGGLANALDPKQPKVDVVEVDMVFLQEFVERQLRDTISDTLLQTT